MSLFCNSFSFKAHHCNFSAFLRDAISSRQIRFPARSRTDPGPQQQVSYSVFVIVTESGKVRRFNEAIVTVTFQKEVGFGCKNSRSLS